MTYIKQDPGTRRWGYEIVEEIDGSAHLGTRVLESVFEGFEAPNEIYPYIQSLQKALLERKYKVGRNREVQSYGYQVYAELGNGKYEILSEQFGFEDSNEAQSHLNALSDAIRGEIKMLSNLVKPVQKSSKPLPANLPPQFKIEEDE